MQGRPRICQVAISLPRRSNWCGYAAHKRREAKGDTREEVLSHRDLAKRANISPTTILNPEAGKVEAQRRTVRKLAEALELDPAELVE